MPRRLRYYFTSGDKKLIAFGYRTIMNTIIQSCGAILIKIAMTKFWPYYNSDQFRNLVLWRGMIHDEINWGVHRSVLPQWSEVSKHCTQVPVPGWEIPMIIGSSIGDNWGEILECKEVEPNIFIPDYETIEVAA